MSTELVGEIPLETLQRALGSAFGSTYDVTATSDSTLKVRSAPFITAKVKVTWHGDHTTLQVVPGGVWILQGINALVIAPKARHVLSGQFRERLEGGPTHGTT